MMQNLYYGKLFTEELWVAASNLPMIEGQGKLKQQENKGIYEVSLYLTISFQ